MVTDDTHIALNDALDRLDEMERRLARIEEAGRAEPRDRTAGVHRDRAVGSPQAQSGLSARVIATQMRLHGVPDDEVGAYLSSTFGIEDPSTVFEAGSPVG